MTGPDRTRHLLLAVESAAIDPPAWTALLADAGRSDMVSVVLLEGNTARWVVPAAPGSQAPGNLIVPDPAIPAEAAAASALVDRIVEAQALVPSIESTTVWFDGDAGVCAALESALGAEPSVTLHVTRRARPKPPPASSRLSAASPHQPNVLAPTPSPAPPTPTKAARTLPTRTAAPGPRSPRSIVLVGVAVAVALAIAGAFAFTSGLRGSTGDAAADTSSAPAPAEGLTGDQAESAEPADEVTPDTAPAPASVLPVAPQYALSAGAESRYSAEYASTVTETTVDGLLLSVGFTASGDDDLRRPDASCLVIQGSDGEQYRARPASIELSEDRPGAFAGRITFPALISGSYGFEYSCSSDYSTAALGSADVPSLGVSRYSQDYYAVVLSRTGTRLGFAVHGGADLRSPETSCLSGGIDAGVTPDVTIDRRWDGPAITLFGTMDFSVDPLGRAFVYSCSGYSPATIG